MPLRLRRAFNVPSLVVPVLMAVLALSACATPPPASDPDAVAEFKETNDPFEPSNRVFYAINDGLDMVLLRPLAQAYRFVVPDVVRSRTHNVLTNLGTPVTLINDMMQGKPRRAGDTLMRMLVNTTFGVLGLFDVATDWGWPAHESDFGITLAVWGMPDGAYLFLPILGPSNPRDAVGFGVDIGLDPFTYGGGAAFKDLSYFRFGMGAIDARERVLDDLDKVTKQALDPYATIRSLARQRRQSQIDDVLNDTRATTPNGWASPMSPTLPPQPSK